MITQRSAREIECMRRAGAIVAETLAIIERMAKPGVTLGELDSAAEAHIRSRKGIPLFKGYHGFPGTICASVNEEVVHGIPGSRLLEEGDILSVDCGARLDGYCGDAAVTLGIGTVSDEAQSLLDVTRTALERGIAAIKAGCCVSDISRAVQLYAETMGCSVVRKYTGHGIGREMHEEPQVPNFVSRMVPDPVLKAGSVVAIEPMVNQGRAEVEVLENGWTVVTKDRKLSAHFEHTVAVTEDGSDILTLLPA
jgi:methionyl aminopeptidase